MRQYLSTREVADRYGQPVWRIRRLFEDCTLPEPERFAGKRSIPLELVPEIAAALKARGWLASGSEAAS
jgi:hypothetical protein